MKILQQAVLPLLFLVLGGAAFAVMLSMGETAESRAPDYEPTPVDVLASTPATLPVRVLGTGTVQPSSTVDLVPQVSGRITDVMDGLVVGTRVDKGDVLARIDSRDYRANLTQAEANVVSAELELQLEQGRVTQAEREWELLGGEGRNPLALREPQLAAARARLDAAEAAATNARLALERTRIVAPFDGIITSESLEIGAMAAPGAPIARIIGTERFRIRVAVPVNELAYLDIPGVNADEGSTAGVTQRLTDGSVLQAPGRILRLLGELDTETRTATLLVAIDDPLEVVEGAVPILPGAYVDVAIEGRDLTDVVAVPREALHEGDVVWVADTEDQLARRTVDIAWAGRTQAYVRSGLEPGDRVVTTPLSLPVAGMKVDVQDTLASAE